MVLVIVIDSFDKFGLLGMWEGRELSFEVRLRS
jgi:hypothetical protein